MNQLIPPGSTAMTDLERKCRNQALMAFHHQFDREPDPLNFADLEWVDQYAKERFGYWLERIGMKDA